MHALPRTIALLFLGVLCLAGALLFAHAPKAESQTSATISGHAWSDTIGWISLNCTNHGTCGTSNYGIVYGYGGTLGGYAWSDSIGWVSAQSSDLTGCPSAPCTATLSGGAFSGWLRALSGGSVGAGGWDGWIRLNGPGYGPTEVGGNVSGYAWGSDVVGWLDFDQVSVAYSCPAFYGCTGNSIIYQSSTCQISTVATCVLPAICVSGTPTCEYLDMEFVPIGALDGHLVARPQIVAEGATARLFWNVANAQSCTVTGTNGDSWSAASSGATGTTTSAIAEKTTYMLSCQGHPGTDPLTVTEDIIINVLPKFEEV